MEMMPEKRGEDEARKRVKISPTKRRGFQPQGSPPVIPVTPTRFATKRKKYEKPSCIVQESADVDGHFLELFC